MNLSGNIFISPERAKEPKTAKVHWGLLGAQRPEDSVKTNVCWLIYLILLNIEIIYNKSTKCRQIDTDTIKRN